MTCIDDIPWDLAEAISHAHKVLDWYGNLQEEDIPPEWMWPFVEEINDWFQDVKAKRGVAGDDRDVVEMTKNEDPRIAALRGR